jgi:hypothetical protein
MEWLRLYVSTLDSPKVQGLPAGLFKAWVNCLCLARINDGVLPAVDVIAFRLRCSTRQAEQWRDDLVRRKLADVMPDGTYRMHDWDRHQYVSDGSTERVRKHREKQRQTVSRNVSVTPSDTEQIQNRSETDSEASAVRAKVRLIRSQEQSGISPATWDDFQKRYAESGKPLNETDWNKAGMEAATLDLTESDMAERVMPALAAELPAWAEREIDMIPFPVNWLKSQPWTRRAVPRPPPLTREQRRQAEIEREWEALGNGTRERQLREV